MILAPAYVCTTLVGPRPFSRSTMDLSDRRYTHSNGAITHTVHNASSTFLELIIRLPDSHCSFTTAPGVRPAQGPQFWSVEAFCSSEIQALPQVASQSTRLAVSPFRHLGPDHRGSVRFPSSPLKNTSLPDIEKQGPLLRHRLLFLLLSN